MANNPMIVEERSRDIGNFLVGRLLPFRQKRQVGPFTFIDHMGPNLIKAGQYLDVDQHPHIGLSTLTYLYEGEVEHRDSTGAEAIITPGSVNFMTAGRGVTHTERTPAHLRNGIQTRLHGYQVWVALPLEYEEMDPVFTNLAAKDIPEWEDNEVVYRLIAGKGFGYESPLPVYSPLFMVDIESNKKYDLQIKGEITGEIAIVVVRGKVKADKNMILPGQMLISKTEDTCGLEIAEDTQVLLFGGKPLPEERYLYWNFVSSSKEKIERAKDRWRSKQFPSVEGDHTYIPLPAY